MKNPVRSIIFGSRRSLESPKNWLAFSILSFFIFWLFIMIPVWTTPGNDFFFQISITPPLIVGLMVTLSLFNALLIVMHSYIRKINKSQKIFGVKETAGGAGIIVSSLMATIGCAACYSSVIAIVGLGSATFIVEHRLWFIGGALFLVFVALAYTGNKIEYGCEVCKI